MELFSLPPPGPAAGLAAAGLLLALGAGRLCGRLKLAHGVRTNYTRKVFHACIFTAAMVVHALGGLSAVNAFAAGVVAVVLFAVWRGGGSSLFEGMARERDAPHRGFFVLVPLATTALGGLASNAWAGDFAMAGYLVTGFGDAVGEPVGAWIGRHPYRVPTLLGVPCTRTLEGSAAVFAASWVGCAIALAAGLGVSPAAAAGVALVVAGVTVAVEAVSPHGTDNLTTMVAASVLARHLAG